MQVILWDQGVSLMTSFIPDYLHEGPSPNTVILGIEASTYELGGGHSSIPTTWTDS